MSVLLLESPAATGEASRLAEHPSSGPITGPSTPARIPAAAPDAKSPDAVRPLSLAMLRSVAGVVGLGLAAGLAGQEHALASAPAGLLTGAGVLLLTTPALVVGHQYLRMHASPSALVGALWDGFSRAGVVALGAVPAVALLSATSDMGPRLGMATLFAIGALGTLYAVRNLGTAESAAGGSQAGGVGIALLWAGLASLIGLRLLALFTF